jgi:hypothetical protein
MIDVTSLYERYAPDVRRFALFLCGDPVMADEITSDTFVRADIPSVTRMLALVVEVLFDIRDTVVKLSERN